MSPYEVEVRYRGNVKRTLSNDFGRRKAAEKYVDRVKDRYPGELVIVEKKE